MCDGVALPPDDAQIDRLLLTIAASGRVSHDDVRILVAYIQWMRRGPSS